MTNKDFANIRICAYHESGHAILAYFVQWTVKSIKIEFKNGNFYRGVTNYDYGNDENFVHYIENFTLNEDIYNNFSKRHREYCLTVADKRIKTIIGGPAAEKRISLGDNYKGIWEITPEFIRNYDFENSNLILSFLQAKSMNYNNNYFLSEIQTVANFITFEQFWNPLKELAERLISSKSYCLSKEEIEDCLTKTGYIAYLNKMYKQ